LSVRAFCVREGVTEPAFYAWRRKLQLQDQELARGRPAFVPVVLPQTDTAVEGDGRVAIELRGGRVLRLPPALPMDQVTALVSAIEAAS
jgi:hypothetical protein